MTNAEFKLLQKLCDIEAQLMTLPRNLPNMSPEADGGAETVNVEGLPSINTVPQNTTITLQSNGHQWVVV